MHTNFNDQGINQHYGRMNALDAILRALQTAGKDIERLTVDDLAPVDQFHLGGKSATQELLRLADIQRGSNVLDVGGGIGGSARLLAVERDCQVTVLDLTEEYCRIGEQLTALTGLSERVVFQHGNALAIPFADSHFDVVWTQHSSMNIADKAGLYAEIQRVLRPSGRFVFHEIMTGPEQPIYFPVPWATDQSMSFLGDPEKMRRLIVETGFKEVAWVDVTSRTIEWLQRVINAQGGATQPLGLQLLLGSRFPEMFKNQGCNLEEGRTVVIQAVFERV